MPKWKDLKRYCERDHWELYKETDHYFFRKVLDDGTVLRIKVSKGSGEIHDHLWREILRKQLQTTQEHFNEVISFSRINVSILFTFFQRYTCTS